METIKKKEVKDTIISQFAHHGEVQLYRASEIADGFERTEKQVLGKGSTGGNHSLTGEYDLYTSKEHPERFYAQVHSDSVMHHHQGEDIDLDQVAKNSPKTHFNGIVPPGLFFITKQYRKDIVNDVMVVNRD
jgi:hypothetical protein